MKINLLKLDDRATIPSRANPFDAGLDLFALEPFDLLPNQRKLIKTGIALAIPEGYEGQIRPRSGLAINHGITVLNTPGTIDPQYRGNIGVILINTCTEYYAHRDIKKAIAQLVIQKVTLADFVEVKELSDTARGVGGFGSSDRVA